MQKHKILEREDIKRHLHAILEGEKAFVANPDTFICDVEVIYIISVISESSFDWKPFSGWLKG